MTRVNIKSFFAFSVLILIHFLVIGSTSRDIDNGKGEAGKIIQRFLEAMGGEELIRAVQTRSVVYSVFLQTRDGYKISRIVDRKGTLKSQREGSQNYLYFDGKKLWNVKGDQKTQLDASVAEQFRKMADLDGPFINPGKKGIRMKYIGKKKVEFSFFNELEVTHADGSMALYCFDQKSGLLKMKKEPSFIMKDGKTTEGPATISYYYNYQKVKGISYPFTWVQTNANLDHMHLFQVEKIEVTMK